jgi:hypothetical protein
VLPKCYDFLLDGLYKRHGGFEEDVATARPTKKSERRSPADDLTAGLT